MSTFSNCFSLNSTSNCNSLSDYAGFLPSIIMQSDVVNTNPSTYWDLPFNISTIDFTTNIVVIDKPIWLPRFNKTYTNSVNGTWQLYKVGLINTELGFTLQLTSQVNSTTFTFELLYEQTVANMHTSGIWVNGINVGFRNPYMSMSPLLTANKKYTLSNTVTGDGSLLIEDDTDGYGKLILTGHTLSVGDRCRILSYNGSGTLTFDTDSVIVHSVSGNNVTFDKLDYSKLNTSYYNNTNGSNPGKLYTNTTVYLNAPFIWYDKTTLGGNGIVNAFNGFLIKYRSNYISMVSFNDGGNNYFNGISTSTDFRTWTDAVSINLTIPSWGSTYIISRNSNVTIGSVLYAPITCLKSTGLVNRIGLIKYDLNNNSYVISTGYINLPSTDDTTNVNYSNAQIYQTSTKTYLLIEVRTSATSLWENRIYECTNITTCANDLHDLSLTLVKTIKGNELGMDGCWNGRGAPYYDGARLPQMIEYNGTTYLFMSGNSNPTYKSRYGNQSNTIGLYIKDNVTGEFNEFMSNPLFVAPLLQDWSYAYQDHFGGLNMLEINNKIYSLISGHCGLINHYRIYPVVFNMATQTEINQFKTNNSLT